MRFVTKPPTHWKNPRHVIYFTQLYHATPKWLTKEQKKQIHDIYREMRKRRRRGQKVAVDHMVPLVSPYVCGLHVPWNLEIISESVNSRKGNGYWPGMVTPGELFDENYLQSLHIAQISFRGWGFEVAGLDADSSCRTASRSRRPRTNSRKTQGGSGSGFEPFYQDPGVRPVQRTWDW